MHGSIRFKETGKEHFINSDNTLRIPPITSIRELIHASYEIEKSEKENELPDKKWLTQLLQPGFSLGGARPKASVIDSNKILYIAKFPSRKDDYNTGIWEHFCHVLAEKAGIKSASTKIIATSDKYHTLLSRRFDRTAEGKLIHFASAMTLLGLSDGANTSTVNGYLDIVDFIIQSCTDVNKNLQELYRRVAFNICIGNSDDHFRNHGFLLTPKGWILSPAYDMNPTSNEYQSLLIDAYTNKADLSILFEACENYLINKDIANQIISEVVTVVKEWKTLATKLGIANREMELLGTTFDSRIKKHS